MTEKPRQKRLKIKIAAPTKTITGPVGKSNTKDRIMPKRTINSEKNTEKNVNFRKLPVKILATAGGNMSKAETSTTPKIFMPKTTVNAKTT